MCCIAWWPNHKKVIAALLSGAFGGGAAIFIPIQTLYINPHRVSAHDDLGYTVDSEIMQRFPNVFVSMALLLSFIQMIGILCLRKPPESPNDDPSFGASQSSIGAVTPIRLPQTERSGIAHDLTVRECLYFCEFWKLFVVAMLNLVVCIFVIVLYQDLSVHYLQITDPFSLCFLGTVGAVCHGVFRVLFCWIYDRCGSFQKCNGAS